MEFHTHTIPYTKDYSEMLKFYQMAKTRAFIQKNTQKNNLPVRAHADCGHFEKQLSILSLIP